jgi:putative Holliday junction resolvase
VQEKETSKTKDFQYIKSYSGPGRLIAIDPGTKKIGLAVTDETRTLARPLPKIIRSSWKRTLSELKAIIAEFDAVAIVIGLPLASDGTESQMSIEARDIARKLRLSLDIPVYLHDERVTSYEANARLWSRGLSPEESLKLIDSESAAVILEDFLAHHLRQK